MFFKKLGIPFKKITVNITKELNDKLENLALFYLCSKTDIVIKALEEYIKKHEKKINKVEKGLEK